jgi:hypothetical protein
LKCHADLHRSGKEDQESERDDGAREIRDAVPGRNPDASESAEGSEVPVRRPGHTLPQDSALQGGRGLPRSENRHLPRCHLRRGDRDDQEDGSAEGKRSTRDLIFILWMASVAFRARSEGGADLRRVVSANAPSIKFTVFMFLHDRLIFDKRNSVVLQPTCQ